MKKKFIAHWFRCSLDQTTVKEKTGFLGLKEQERQQYIRSMPDLDDYASRLENAYNELDENGYDVVNVIPINTGETEECFGVSNKKKVYLGEVGFSLTRAAIVIGRLREE